MSVRLFVSCCFDTIHLEVGIKRYVMITSLCEESA